MSSGSRREREQKALDALIVSQLRRYGCEGGVPDPNNLPELTEEEKKALKALGPNYISRLLAGQVPKRSGREDDHGRDAPEPAFAGEELAFGLNRAETIDPETAEELERRRREIIERLRHRRERREEESGG